MDAFGDAVEMAWKAGSVPNHRSWGGWIKLPVHECSTAAPREYVCGVFFHNWTTISPNFGITDVLVEMLRGEVRAALEDWAACVACGEPGAGPCNVPHGGVGCDDSVCCEMVCALDPLCCDPGFGWDAACASYAMALCEDTPSNDDCVGEIDLHNCQVSAFDISNATPDGPTHLPECNWDASITKDLWYEYVATATGILTISVCTDDEAGDPTDPFDLWVGVYSDCICGAVQQTSLVDCTVGTAACGVGGTELDVFVTQGQCYKIRVGTGLPQTGTGLISLSCAIENDPQAEPTDLGDFTGSASFSTVGATTDGPSHPTCLGALDGQIHNDVWYTWTAPCTGTLMLDTCGTADFDTRLAVYDGCTGLPTDTTLLGCNDDDSACAGFTSRLIVPVSAGLCYLIRVGGYNGGAGSGELSIACAAPCPGDTDGDGDVDVDDLTAVILDWGTDGSRFNGDVDGTGDVNVDDLTVLILGWGPCP
jgi:hypothetical protein